MVLLLLKSATSYTVHTYVGCLWSTRDRKHMSFGFCWALAFRQLTFTSHRLRPSQKIIHDRYTHSGNYWRPYSVRNRPVPFFSFGIAYGNAGVKRLRWTDAVSEAQKAVTITINRRQLFPEWEHDTAISCGLGQLRRGYLALFENFICDCSASIGALESLEALLFVPGWKSQAWLMGLTSAGKASSAC